MGKVTTALTAGLLIILSSFSFLPMFPLRAHASTSNIQWQDDYENYPCGSFPGAWSLRFNGAGDSSQYVDCSTAYHGSKSLHMQGRDVTTTGSRWASMADKAFSPVGANEIGYSVFVKTGPLHSPGTGEVACDVGFEVGSYLRPDKNLWGVYPGLVQFTDNQTILPGDMTYTPGAWYHVTASVDMFNNAFLLVINGTDVGTFQADTYGNGTFLPSISAFAVVSNHAGRECWFDQVTVESSTIVDNGDFSHGLDSWSTVSPQTSHDSRGVEYPIFENLTQPPNTGNPLSPACFPSSKLGNPFLSIDVPYGADGYLEQTVTIPAYGKAQLSFVSWGWQGLGIGLVDAYARIVDANSTEHSLEPPPEISRFPGYWTPPPLLNPLDGFCTGYSPKTIRFDLTAYSGQTVKLRLGATTRFSVSTTDAFASFDDVQISSASFLVPTTVSISADPSTVAEVASATASTQISTTVLDQLGNVMEGVSVSFTTTDGQLSSSNGVTDSDGVTAVNLIGRNLPACNPQLACNPQSVTVTASAAVTALTAVRNSLNVTFLPPGFGENTWTQSRSFHIHEIDVKLGQYLGIVATAWNWCVFIRICHGPKVHLDKVPPVRIFLLTPSAFSATALSNFATALSYYFGISVPHTSEWDFAPMATLILEAPVVQAIKGFFSVEVNSQVAIPLPSFVTSWLTESNNITTTPSGYIDTALTFSLNTNTQELARDAIQLAAQLVVLAGGATLFWKGLPTGAPASDTIRDTILAAIKVQLGIGDITVSVIKDDLERNGSLRSYTLFDFYRLLSVASNLADIAGLVVKIIDFVKFLATAAGSGLLDLLADAQTIVTGVDLGVELLPYVPSSICPHCPELKDDDLFNWFEAGLNIATTFLDPPNATIIPSFYDGSGHLILGYNPQDGTITTVSPGGVLLPDGHGYLALLNENSTGPTAYSEILNGLGTNALVPYEVRLLSYNQTAPVVHIAGVLPGGSNVTIPAVFNSTGGIIPAVYLRPTLSAHALGNSLTIVARATLSDGTLSSASNGTLVIGSSHYEMTEDNSSTFEATVAYDASTAAGFSVYLFSPNALGGFASGLTPVAPETAVTASPIADSYGWNNVSVAVSLRSSNGLDSNGQRSEVKEISYALTGAQSGSATIPGNNTSIAISAEGNTTISYYAKDNSGNRELTHSLSFQIDKTSPTVRGSKSPTANSDDWNNVSVRVHFDCFDTLSGVASVTRDQIITLEGRNQSLSGVCTDRAGNSAAATVNDINIDTTPPVITSPQSGQAFILRQPVLADAECTDKLSGVNTCIVPTGFIDTDTVGAHSYIVTSTDRAGNMATLTVQYQVHYNFALLLPQPASRGTQIGRTIPVRFQLMDALGNFVPSATARIWVDSLSNPGKTSGASNIGNYFRFDTTGNQYIFNLSTNGLTAGPHTVYLTLDDGTVHSINLNLTN